LRGSTAEYIKQKKGLANVKTVHWKSSNLREQKGKKNEKKVKIVYGISSSRIRYALLE
jgi:hypothetical protein